MKRKFLTLFAAVCAVSLGSAVADDSCTPLVSKAKITFTYQSAPEGCLKGKFKIGDNNFVYFTEGNLQWIKEEGWENYKFRFAEHQYQFNESPDFLYIPNEQKSSGAVSCDDPTGRWIGHFYLNQQDEIKCGEPKINPKSPQGQYDFGNFPIMTYKESVSSKVTKTTFPVGTFRSLSVSEWNYIFAHHKYYVAKVTINSDGKDCYGIVILPFDCKVQIASAEDLVQEFDFTTWQTIESVGGLFLPATGYTQLYRNFSTSVWRSLDIKINGTDGLYFADNVVEKKYDSYYQGFGINYLKFTTTSWEIINDFAYHACTVRLVKDAE